MCTHQGLETLDLIERGADIGKGYFHQPLTSNIQITGIFESIDGCFGCLYNT